MKVIGWVVGAFVGWKYGDTVVEWVKVKVKSWT